MPISLSQRTLEATLLTSFAFLAVCLAGFTETKQNETLDEGDSWMGATSSTLVVEDVIVGVVLVPITHLASFCHSISPTNRSSSLSWSRMARQHGSEARCSFHHG